MKNKNLFLCLHAILAIGAMVSFLAMPFMDISHKVQMTGAQFLNRLFGESQSDLLSFWPLLYIITPIIALYSLLGNKKHRLFASIFMFLPSAICFADKADNVHMLEGGITFCIIPAIMILLNLMEPSEPAQETEPVVADANSQQEQQVANHNTEELLEQQQAQRTDENASNRETQIEAIEDNKDSGMPKYMLYIILCICFYLFLLAFGFYLAN